MNWGKGITIAFVSFALFIGSLVVVCMRQDVALVSPDYYKQELAFQQQIDQAQNAANPESKPKITVNNNQVQVAFDNFKLIEAGELKLFRPSDARQDRTYAVKQSADSLQFFDVRIQQRGMYKASLRWTIAGKIYFIEETIYI